MMKCYMLSGFITGEAPFYRCLFPHRTPQFIFLPGQPGQGDEFLLAKTKPLEEEYFLRGVNEIRLCRLVF